MNARDSISSIIHQHRFARNRMRFFISRASMFERESFVTLIYSTRERETEKEREGKWRKKRGILRRERRKVMYQLLGNKYSRFINTRLSPIEYYDLRPHVNSRYICIRNRHASSRHVRTLCIHPSCRHTHIEHVHRI